MDAESEVEGSLKNVVEQDELKWIFVGGKGGVGKTTCSCCLAVHLAERREKVGEKVLIISTDPAHNLSDAFRQKFTKTPTLVQGFQNLYAMEVDPTVESDEEDQGGLLGMGSMAELANAIPGMDEAMSFGEMMKLVQTMDYSVIVFDTAPTGHTLRLLQFPSTLEKGLGKLMALKNKFGGMVDQMSNMFGAADEFGTDALMGRLEQLKNVIEKVNLQFKNPDLTTFVCVCIPEFLSLFETERLVQELARFEMDTHNIIINQVLFLEEGDDSRLLRARVRMQQKYLEQFRDLYEGFHLTLLPLLPEELQGADALKQFGENLLTPYKPKNPVPGGRIAELESQVKLLQQQLLEARNQISSLQNGSKRSQANVSDMEQLD